MLLSKSYHPSSSVEFDSNATVELDAPVEIITLSKLGPRVSNKLLCYLLLKLLILKHHKERIGQQLANVRIKEITIFDDENRHRLGYDNTFLA